MKRLPLLALVAAIMLAAAASAYAAVTNTYTVKAETTSKKAGTSKKPVPIGLDFNYTVGEVDGKRPSPVRKYSIFFAGLRVNTNLFPACTLAKLQANKASCSKAIVGRGFVKNETGASNNEADKSVTCNLALTIYNVRNNKAILLLEGGSGETDVRRQCPIDFGPSNGSIPANYVRKSNGNSLEFSVPENLLHPAPGLDNAVANTQSTILKRTRRVKGKTRGYYEAIGQCRGGKRTVRVQFTPESGSTQSASNTTPCKK